MNRCVARIASSFRLVLKGKADNNQKLCGENEIPLWVQRILGEQVKNSLMKERPLQIKYQGQTIEIILRERDCYPNEEIWVRSFNPLSANTTKWSNTLKQFVGYCNAPKTRPWSSGSLHFSNKLIKQCWALKPFLNPHCLFFFKVSY